MYSELLTRCEETQLSSKVLFFLDEMPSINRVLREAFIRKSDMDAITEEHRNLALTQQNNPTSLLYVTRLALLELVSTVSSNLFALPITGAGTDVAIALMPETLPSPFTRDNIKPFTELLYVTSTMISKHLKDEVSSSIHTIIVLIFNTSLRYYVFNNKL